MQLGAMPTELVWVPPLVEIENMKPGSREVQTFTLSNTNDVPLQLSWAVISEGSVFEGASPLVVRFDLSSDERCPVNTQAIPPHSTVIATMTAELPVTAGNEYQGRSGITTLTVTATEAAVCGSTSAPPPVVEHLPGTGADPFGILTAAIVFVIIGAVMRWGPSTRRQRRQP